MSGRIIVFAYGEVGTSCLELLLSEGRDVVALFTHEDDAAETQWFRSCAQLARERGIPVHTMDAKDPQMELIVTEARPDLILSLYYRKMLPMRILDHARLGAFNMHGGLLPKYRGRAPLNWAIINGERETGVTLHVMVAKADAGDIIDREAVSIGPEETAGEIAPRVAQAAVRIIARQIDNLLKGTAPRIKQDETQATYFGARTAADGLIDWTQSARRIADLVRAVTAPFPGAFTTINGRKLMVWKVHVVEGAGQPGEVLQVSPPVIGAGERCIELVYYGFEGEAGDAASKAARTELKAGVRLGS